MDLVLAPQSTLAPKVYGAGQHQSKVQLLMAKKSMLSSSTPKELVHWMKIKPTTLGFSLWPSYQPVHLFITLLDQLMKMHYKIWVWLWTSLKAFKFQLIILKKKRMILKNYQTTSHPFIGLSEILLYNLSTHKANKLHPNNI